ncbi:MAG: carboxypeptidase-like regulatory domain-containing protein, partial [Bacteroidota bacterium]
VPVYLLLVFLLVVTCFPANAKGAICVSVALELSGTVTTDDGILPGATVHLKGTEIATVTDKNGEFVFPQALEEGDVIVFSFLGFKTKELLITGETPAKVEITLVLDDIYIADAPLTNEKLQPKTSVASRFWQKVKSVF